MKITLRKANALQNSINDALKQILVVSEVALTEFHRPEDEIARVRAEAEKNIQRRDRLHHALYDIRQRVAGANTNAGVSTNLTLVAEIEKQIQFYTGLSGKEVRQGHEVVAGKLRKIAETKSERLYGYSDTVNTSVWTAEDIAGFKKTVSDLKKSKQQLQDIILETNVRTEIELSDETVAVLQAEGLI
jgi:uncharacterized protein YdcH (DUF465 family)